jgi:hypothetical protein
MPLPTAPSSTSYPGSGTRRGISSTSCAGRPGRPKFPASSRRIEIRVAVINRAPDFSEELHADVVGVLRRELPEAREIGRFEVRWKR